MTESGARFAAPALETVSRVLGLCDRQSNSPTFGCCDRLHWHYRAIDFPNARLQESGLLFALAYSAPLAGNRFRNKQRMHDWSRAAWRYWLNSRNSDGSVAEAYPNERSFCGTSFTAAGFIETVALLGGATDWKEELAQASITFRWLAHNSSPDVANQMAASLLALTGYAKLTGRPEMVEAARRRRNEFVATIWPDGTFPEYDGFDTGYQSITLSILMRVLRLMPDPELQGAAERGERRLRGAINDFGMVDVTRNSRRTQFLYPYGLKAIESPAAARISAGIGADMILRPTWMDDRYCIGMASDYLLAAWE
jgi:hypothetical protein